MESVRIKSTGLVGRLITSSYSIPIRNITFEADEVFDLQGDGVNTAIDWQAVNIQSATEIGYIKDYSNVIFSDCAFFNSGNSRFELGDYKTAILDFNKAIEIDFN